MQTSPQPTKVTNISFVRWGKKESLFWFEDIELCRGHRIYRSQYRREDEFDLTENLGC